METGLASRGRGREALTSAIRIDGDEDHGYLLPGLSPGRRCAAT
jgi:hypothetical protein